MEPVEFNLVSKLNKLSDFGRKVRVVEAFKRVVLLCLFPVLLEQFLKVEYR